MSKNNFLTNLLAILCVSLTGCASRSVEPLSGGYEAVVHSWTSFSEPEANQISLKYRKPNGGRIMVWPSVRGYVLKDDMAVFVGEAACEPRDPDEPRATMSRLFAVRSPELPLDITDEVLWRWSKKSEIDFVKSLEIAGVVYIKDDDNQLEIRFSFWGQNSWPRIISLDWNQISDIMREAKEKGAVRKDRVWGTSYIAKEFKPEVQK